MSDLLWPGDERAGALMSDGALLLALVRVEAAWLDVLVAAGIAPPGATDDLTGLVDPAGQDSVTVAAGAEVGGNPVIPLVDLLRTRVAARNGTASRWVHRGLTSQDVLDTALMLCTGDAVDRVLADIRRQVTALRGLADRHRSTVRAGRTLTQHAVPTTFGLTAAGWVSGVLDAAEDLRWVGERLPAQVGGAAGTLAAVTELAGLAGAADPAGTAVALAGDLATRLRLRAAAPWHTSRRPVTRIGDAFLACVDSFGRVAGDVLTGGRPELRELSESTPGGSSTMPRKRNPVRAVLVRRAALSAPQLGAQLHVAAANAVDERPDGAWHAEGAALRGLARVTVVAASQTADLLDGLVVHPARMNATFDGALPDLLAEREGMRALFEASVSGQEHSAARYLGAADPLIDAALARADRYLEGRP